MKHSYAKIDAHKVIELCLAEKGRLAYRCQEKIELHIELNLGKRKGLFGTGGRFTRQELIDGLIEPWEGSSYMTLLDYVCMTPLDMVDDVNRIMGLAQRSITNGDGYVRLTTEDHELIR